MWFITSILFKKPENSESPARAETHRTFGYYSTPEKARHAVAENYGNMHECLYNFLVIENIGEGVHALADDNEEWYEWNEEDNNWVAIAKPPQFMGIINWAIG